MRPRLEPSPGAGGAFRESETSRYFDERVRLKRPEIDPARCMEIIAAPLRTEAQDDGRIRFWGEVTLRGEDEPPSCEL